MIVTLLQLAHAAKEALRQANVAATTIGQQAWPDSLTQLGYPPPVFTIRRLCLSVPCVFQEGSAARLALTAHEAASDSCSIHNVVVQVSLPADSEMNMAGPRADVSDPKP
jgi:hypothetical protein